MNFLPQGFVLYSIVLIASAATLQLLLRFLYKWMSRKEELSGGLWYSALLRSIFLPASLAIWLSAAIVILRLLNVVPPGSLAKGEGLLILTLVAWALVHLVDSVRGQLLQKATHLEPTMINFVARLSQASAVVLSLLVGMQILGYSVSVLLTFGGVGGLVIGIAAKDIIANFLAGIIIHLNAPFKEGDYIRCRQADIAGVVMSTSWRITKLRAYEREVIHIPNTILMDNTVENISDIDNRRIREIVGIRYGDATLLPRVVVDIKTMLAGHAGISQEKQPLVVFYHFGDSSLDIMVNAYATTSAWSEYMKTKHDVLLKIYEIVTGHGADVAYPTHTLDFPPQSAKS